MEERDIQEIINEAEELYRNIESENLEKLIEITNRLEELTKESNCNRNITIIYGKSIVYLTLKGGRSLSEHTISKLKELINKKFKNDIEIKTILAETLTNLASSYTDSKKIEEIVFELKNFYYENQNDIYIAQLYIKSMISLIITSTEIKKVQEIFSEIEKIFENDIYQNNSDIEVIAELYTIALGHLVNKGEERILNESLEKVKKIYTRFENNITVIEHYAYILAISVNIQSLDEIKKYIPVFKVLNEKSSYNNYIGVLYSKFLLTVLKKQTKEEKKETLNELKILNKNFEEDNIIAQNYAKALNFCIKEQTKKEQIESIQILKELKIKFDKDLGVLFTEEYIKTLIEVEEEKLKSFDITKPLDSNSTSKDYLDREHISSAISSYIKIRKDSISTIGIFSTWGNGKSSFIKNILEKLKIEPNENEVEILPIEIDAVFSDDCEKIWIIIYKKLIEEYKNQISNCKFIQNFLKLIFHLCSIGILYLLFPLLSIKPLLVYGYIFLLVYSVIFLLFIEFKKYYKWLNNLSLKIQDFLLETIVYFILFYKPTIILIANIVMFFMLKSDFIKYTEKVKFANLEINKGSLFIGIISLIWIFCDFTKNIVSVLNKESFISAYKHEEKLGFKSVIHEKINNVIEKIINDKDRKILIIVDELDRSSLDKINEIIESTHILLNNNNLMFLFSVNPRQIGKALLLKEEESLANEIDIYKYGRHYIEKYMDVYVYLPRNTNYDEFLNNLIEEAEPQKRVETKLNQTPVKEMKSTFTLKAVGTVEKRFSSFKRKIIQFTKDEKQEIKITINNIKDYNNLTPRKVKTIITLSTLAVQIFSTRNVGSTRAERLSLMKFILINLGLLDFMDMSEILKYEGSTYYKFLEKVISKTEKTNNDELVKDIDIDFIDSYGKEYLSLFAEELDFNQKEVKERS